MRAMSCVGSNCVLRVGVFADGCVGLFDMSVRLI